MENGSSPTNTERNFAIRHVEVVTSSSLPSTARLALQNGLQLWIKSRKDDVPVGKNGEIDLSFVPSAVIPQANSIIKMRVVDDDNDTGINCFASFPPECHIKVHTFELSHEEICTEEIEPSGGDDEWTAGCDSLALPHATLDGLWENLIFDSNVKRQLLEYAQSTMLFSDRKVSEHIVHWNRILLLHG